MADRTFIVELLTLLRRVLKTDAVAVNAPGEDGRFGILAGHEPFTFALQPGVLEITYPGGNRDLFAVSNGFLAIQPDGVTILARSAERPSEIDEERDRRAEERARRRIREKSRDTDLARAELALKKAIARISARHTHT